VNNTQIFKNNSLALTERNHTKVRWSWQQSYKVQNINLITIPYAVTPWEREH